MLLARLTLAAAALFAGITTAAAGDIAPGDVKIVDGVLARPVSDAPASAAEGRKIFADRKLGNCLACHANSDLSEQLFHGGVGPSPGGPGEALTPVHPPPDLVDLQAVFGGQTLMPGLHSPHL